MDNGINSGSAGVNDTFTAVTTTPLLIDGVSVVSAGATVTGRITGVRPAGNGGRSGMLEVKFERIRFSDGTERRLSAILTNKLVGKKTHVFSALAIIGSTAAGGIIGLISKANNGAAVGAGIGAGVGTGVALSRKGKNVGIDSDQDFEIELTKALTLPADGF